MRIHFKRRLFAFGVLLLLEISAWQFTRVEGKSLAKSVELLAKRCTPETLTSETTRTDCLYKSFLKLVSKSNFSEVVDAAEKVYSPNCHAAAHLVAKVAYEKGATFSEILKGCKGKCGYGCLHGAFQSRFESDLNGFIGDVGLFCRDIPSGQTEDAIACWHIVGHGVGEYYGTQTEKAIKTCSELGSGLPGWHCLNGLMMEYGEPFPWNKKLFKFSTDFYLNLCSKMPAFYKNDCYGSAAYSVLKVTGNEDESVAICGKIPNNLTVRRKCAAEAGGTFALMRAEAKTVFLYCKKFKELSGECIFEAASTFTSGGFPETARDICSEIIGPDRSVCFGSIGLKIEESKGFLVRREFCNRLESVDASACSKDPLDKRKYLLPSYTDGVQ